MPRRAGVPRRPGAIYDRLWRREIGAELRDSVFIQRYLFGDHARVNRLIRVGRHAPWLTRAIVEYGTGRRGYAAIRRTVLARSPKTVIALAWRAVRQGIS